ncbi:FecR family protein [Roseivirga misakiensis]|uniref:Uncharacterized protein n=1 Tax=Roseivirga misakiensis TaxID=1563681 RepID=A0A1E5T1X8_9BACT|nr:FecR family protein [Roseivirga misakiensis]OEK05383.1 hypothetical protein BFP71_18505 [Roseivirga misakiensis]
MEKDKYDKDLTSGEEQKLFSKLEFTYSRSKEDVWKVLDGLTEEESEAATNTAQEEPTKTVKMSWWSMGIAASMTILLCYGLFARFYTTTISAAPGEMASHTLPDNSVVTLNAASSITYSPYWWKFERALELKGEGFFEVEKGESFKVHSAYATTEVLGTSFNIYARDESYEVFCATGKVSVKSIDAKEVLLKPGDFVRLNRSTFEKSSSKDLSKSVLSWKNNKFNYNTTPLWKVFSDLERHYGVTIQFDAQEIDDNATVVTDRPETVTEALNLILNTDIYDIEETSEKTYVIKKR